MPRARRDRRQSRLPDLSTRRSSGREHSREPRSRPGGDAQLRLRVSDLADHDQPRARRRPQGRPGLRSADRGRHSVGDRRRDAAAISTASCMSASCRSMDRFNRRVVCCRSPPKRDATAPKRCCCPSTISPKPRSSSGLRLLPVRTLREAVERLNQADSDWPAPPALGTGTLALGTPGTLRTPGTR